MGNDTSIRYIEIFTDYPKDYRVMMVLVGGLVVGRVGGEEELTLERITRDLLPYYLSVSTSQEGGKMPLLTSSPLIQCETQNTIS